jgi:hypothetical protein
MTDAYVDVPSGLEHIDLINSYAEKVKLISDVSQAEVKDSLEIIGASLSILYKVGTCHRKCFGGSHILEALSGRAYNLSCSALILIFRGFYDEALNLTRSLGEIGNLVSLSVVDKNALSKWISSDARTRLREFSPAKIREIVHSNDASMLCVDKDWYSSFCEKYTHVHAGTKPNMHNQNKEAYVGGRFQMDGLIFSIGELFKVTTHIAALISKYAELDDLFDELFKQLIDLKDR